MERLAGWNRRTLQIFGPVLILAGVAGFVLPPNDALTSGAPPYNLFHIAFGLLGTALAFRGSERSVARFNAAFGAIDLYQLVAGLAGLFPAAYFRYHAADHALHLLIGAYLFLVGVAWMVRHDPEARPG